MCWKEQENQSDFAMRCLPTGGGFWPVMGLDSRPLAELKDDLT
jgi:hypothetical protein